MITSVCTLVGRCKKGEIPNLISWDMDIYIYINTVERQHVDVVLLTLCLCLDGFVVYILYILYMRSLLA